MGKAREITGLDCNADASYWATEVLRTRFDEVFSLRQTAPDFSDAESVHRMRVAMRRLRSALRDFAPFMNDALPKKAIKKLKWISDALGTVRDQDVAIIALEKFAASAKKESLKIKLENLAETRRVQRENSRANLAKIVSGDYFRKISEDFLQALAGGGNQSKKSKKRVPVSFNQAGRSAVTAGLQKLFARGTSFYDPFKPHKLHQMRIAAKRLRYAIELFTACWGDRIVPFAAEIAELQAELGKVHDCDVWIKFLGKQLRRKSEPDSSAATDDFQTSAWLLARFVKKRDRHYRAALKFWRKWQEEDFAGKLRDIIQTD